MGVHRIWHDGLIPVEGKRPLDSLRNRLVSRQREQETPAYEVADPGCSDDGGERRCDLKFSWDDKEGRYSVQVLLALRYTAGEDRIAWLLAAACTRPWRTSIEAPAHRIGLEELGASGCDEIPLDGPSLSLRGWPREECDRVADLLAEAMVSPRRTTALLIISDDHAIPVDGWPGLVNVFDVDDRFRRSLNGCLPLGCAVPAGARLFVPPCDELPDIIQTETPTPEMLGLAISQQIQARSRSPLPEYWAEVPSVREWWSADPFTKAEPSPDAALAEKLRNVERELAEARGVISILRKRSAADEAERARAVAESKHLRSRIEELSAVDADTLHAQISQLQSTMDHYAKAFEEVEHERDDLRRTNGLLAGALARITGTDETGSDGREPAEFPSFAELFETASKALTNLDITAELGPTTILDHHPKAAAWRRKAWDALRTLDAYAGARNTIRRSGREPGPELCDVLAFARTGQPGSLISANIIALTESETVTTNERLRQARTFRVSPDTNPTGREYFGAHIALERFKPPAPRLHFLDDTDHTGHIYVGYLGAHLPTSKTN
ncbi:hypothetical protein [Amycolatopsis sp. NPDC059021]|uniref:hypothetical protein n=1 Tax=Amycolatopsis sp. NPDC059021 TaxID=3346704 RepID=UPI00366F038B